MTTRPPVPRLARWLLKLAAGTADRASVVADLEEEAAARAREGNVGAARRWSRRQAITSVAPLAAARLRSFTANLWRTLMGIWRGLRSDLVLAFRRLRHAPGFSAVCIATLALGIGGNTAVFILIDRVVLEPLPVPRPAELYRLGDGNDCCVNTGLQGSFSLFSYDLYQHLLVAAPEFRQLAAFQANVRAVTVGGADRDAPGQNLTNVFVSGNYFAMLDVTPAVGRLLQPADDRPDAPLAAVISHRAWTERFGGRPEVVGMPLTLNNVAATIVGVAPPGFYGETLRPNPADVWTPLASEPRLQPAARLLEAKSAHWLYVMGRLPHGTDPVRLQPPLTAALQQWLNVTPPLAEPERARIPQQHVVVANAPAGVSSMRNEVAPQLRLLQTFAAALLLVACANLANLLLVRGLGRRSETAVRLALGAPRSRLVAQFLVEGLLLAAAGGFAGLLLSFAGARAIVNLAFRGAPAVPIDPSPSWTVIAFAVMVSILTGAIFGTAPAWLASRSDPVDAVRGGVRTTADRGSALRRSILALQIAMSVVLIACAGLLGRSLVNLQSQDFGFRIDDRYVADLGPSLATIPVDQLAPVYAALQEHLRGIPGVRNAAFSLYGPMSGDNWSGRIVVDGHDPSERLIASWNRVSPGYFDTIGTPLLRGRAFDGRDKAGAPLVTVVSQTFVRRFFGDRDPIGRRIGFASTRGGGTLDFEIVGVVGDAKYQDPRAASYATFFLPFLQGPRLDRSQYANAIELQAPATASLGADLRRELASIDRRLTIAEVRTMREQVGGHFNLDRLIARLGTVFGGTALLLSCLGLYGLTAQMVARRTREIGIRMAIGASRPAVMMTVLRAALLQLAIGIGIGLPATLAAGRLLQTKLFAVSGHDPVVLAVAIAMLALSATAAALLPARRAATIDPVRALRME